MKYEQHEKKKKGKQKGDMKHRRVRSAVATSQGGEEKGSSRLLRCASAAPDSAASTMIRIKTKSKERDGRKKATLVMVSAIKGILARL